MQWLYQRSQHWHI